MAVSRGVRRAVLFGGIAAAILSAALVVACLDMTPVPPDEVVTFKIPIPEAQPPPPPREAGETDSTVPPTVDGGTGTGDSGMVIMADVEVEAPYVPPCIACLQAPDVPGPGCGTEHAACFANPQCHAAYECAVANGCLLLQSGENAIICTTPCVVEAGIASASSPAGMAVQNIADCFYAEAGCGPICAPLP